MDKPEYRIYVNTGKGIPDRVFRDAEKVSAVMSREQQMILARVASVLREVDHCFHALITKRNCPDLCHQNIHELICELDIRFGMSDLDEHFMNSDAWHVRFGSYDLDEIEDLYKEDNNGN